ncbi:DUF742 domain-containing protein [Streptomyces sp. NPDC050738]|uniref:DUF742 domain-containing protein n=1 Tax=Streptomyces sp. NPDC050738 TaxID=3154744 RepID=UPI00343A3AF7
MSEGSAEDALFVRPFIMTGGRSEPVQTGLRLETLVVAVDDAQVRGAGLEFERQRIVALCAQPKTVAEVADGIGVPLGVAKVLIADLMVGGLLAGRQPTELPLHMLERIRDHVRAL